MGLTFCLKPGMFPYICFCFFWVGVSTTAAAPILLELVAEVTYPHPEMMSAGVCLTVFGLSTFGFVQLSQVLALLPPPPLARPTPVAWPAELLHAGSAGVGWEGGLSSGHGRTRMTLCACIMTTSVWPGTRDR